MAIASCTSFQLSAIIVYKSLVFNATREKIKAAQHGQINQKNTACETKKRFCFVNKVTAILNY